MYPAAALLRDIPDFPQPGIVFKDITPVLADPAAFATVIGDLTAAFAGAEVTHVVGIESRGFIIGAPVALALEAGFIPVRKPGKLPADTARLDYDLEYGTDAVEIHRDALGPGNRVLVVDDVIATGGTGAATLDLVRSLGAEPVGFAAFVELTFLGGRDRLGNVRVVSLVQV